MKEKTIFQKDFIMVVIGQIISLFGNAILRFALPLYLLNQTKSAALYGLVSACAFIPMIILAPIGGIVADRVNKRNVMVILDFSTAFLVLVFSLLLGKLDLVVLLVITLIILYGIQGAYQPAVQASIPALVSGENLMPANAAINLVSSLAGLLGPVLGGLLFSFWGIRPILFISIFCFLFSAIMEIFIHIPFQKQEKTSSIWAIVSSDMRESGHFILKENSAIGKGTIFIAFINLFFSSLIIIGLPVIVTQMLGFDEQTGNQLYGYAQGALSAGGLLGGLLAGVVGNRIRINQVYTLLLLCAIPLLPMGIVLCAPVPAMAAYVTIVISCLVMMVLSTLFSIRLMAYVQLVTPINLIGKIMSLLMCICMLAQPIGQAMYGVLFQSMNGNINILFFVALVLTIIIALCSKKTFDQVVEE